MSDPIVGTIFRFGPQYYPTFTQPGGPGTNTFPQQGNAPYINGNNVGINEIDGQFIAGCGHSFQSWSIFSCAVGGVASAVICCPYCLFIQSITTPYANINQFPIIFG